MTIAELKMFRETHETLHDLFQMDMKRIMRGYRCSLYLVILVVILVLAIDIKFFIEGRIVLAVVYEVVLIPLNTWSAVRSIKGMRSCRKSMEEEQDLYDALISEIDKDTCDNEKTEI